MRHVLRLLVGFAALAMAVAAGVSAPLSLSIVEAEVGADMVAGIPVLTIVLAPESRDAFAEFTRANVGKRTIVTIGGMPVMEPVIRESITGGTVQIAGDFSREDLEAIAARLSGGATLDVDVADGPDRPDGPGDP